MTSIENRLREEYQELLTYAGTQHACRCHMAGHIVHLEAALRNQPGGEQMVMHLRQEAGYDRSEIEFLDDQSADASAA